jgi:ferredoxin
MRARAERRASNDEERLQMALKVWIDQDLCTGDGICVEICPSLFAMSDDGLAYVKEKEWSDLFGPAGGTEPALKGGDGTASVPDGELADAIDAAEECPGECIFFDEV